jgi:hypothetical protein
MTLAFKTAPIASVAAILEDLDGLKESHGHADRVFVGEPGGDRPVAA